MISHLYIPITGTPAYPKTLLSVLQTACVIIFIFLARFFLFVFFADALIDQNKKVSKDNFSIIHLVRTVRKHTFSIIQMHYKTATLGHSDTFILFTSAEVVLDQTLQNTFSKSNTPCVLLSLMPTRTFLTVVVWLELVSLVSSILSPLLQFDAASATCH